MLKPNTEGTKCVPRFCPAGQQINASGDTCVSIPCFPGATRQGADCVCNDPSLKLNANGTKCVPSSCPQGKQLNVAGDACVIMCPPGYVVNSNGMQCDELPCPIPGTKRNGPNCVCENSKFEINSSNTRCELKPCGPNRKPNWDNTDCDSTCPPGSYYKDGNCICDSSDQELNSDKTACVLKPCGPNRKPNPENTACVIACPPNSEDVNGACICKSNYKMNSSKTQCFSTLPCSVAGQTRDSEGNCFCPPGVAVMNNACSRSVNIACSTYPHAGDYWRQISETQYFNHGYIKFYDVGTYWISSYPNVHPLRPTTDRGTYRYYKSFYWDPGSVGRLVHYRYGICGTGALYINGGLPGEIITNSFIPKGYHGVTYDFPPIAGINTLMIEVSGSTANACWFESDASIFSDASWSVMKVN